MQHKAGDWLMKHKKGKPESINPGLGDQAEKTRWRTGSVKVRQKAVVRSGTGRADNRNHRNSGWRKVLEKPVDEPDCGGRLWQKPCSTTPQINTIPHLLLHMTPEFHWGYNCNAGATRNAIILIFFTSFVLKKWLRVYFAQLPKCQPLSIHMNVSGNKRWKEQYNLHQICGHIHFRHRLCFPV